MQGPGYSLKSDPSSNMKYPDYNCINPLKRTTAIADLEKVLFATETLQKKKKC